LTLANKHSQEPYLDVSRIKIYASRNEISHLLFDECMMNRLHRSLLSLARRPEFRSDEAIAGACLGVAIAGVDMLLVIAAFLVLVHF